MLRHFQRAVVLVHILLIVSMTLMMVLSTVAPQMTLPYLFMQGFHGFAGL